MSDKRRLSLMVDEELFAALESARGAGTEFAVPREAFVRAVLKRWMNFRYQADAARAVEQALEGQQKRGNAREAEERDVVNREPSKPAEQPETTPEVRRRYGATMAPQAREFRPYPKGGK